MKNKILQSGGQKGVLKSGVYRFYHFDFLKRSVTRSNLANGFTLVEVIVVVVILAIAGMMAVPMMSSADTFQLRSAANMLAGDLEYAKNSAISRGETFSVVFDDADDSYCLKDAGGNLIEHPVKKGFDYVVDFSDDGRLNKVKIDEVNLVDSIVEFDSLGSPDEGGTITLNAGLETIVVTIEPVTGYISISN